jgi:CAAX prenyl protease-like protein
MREAGTMSAERKGHGWGAYFWPYLSFLLIIEIAGRLPEAAAPWILPVKVAIPLALLGFYYARGHYPELRGNRFTLGGVVQDIAVGVAGAALWMAPYLLSDSLRPVDAEGFDPNLYGPSLAGLALGIRAVGYGIATPFVEELFVRSWLVRYIDVFDRGGDFRAVPIARYTLRSFAVVVVWFTFSHVPWEWPVAAAWVVMTQLYFYHRGQLGSMVIVHAASNLSILAFVVACNGMLLDGQGVPIDLWFFV